MPSPVGHSLMAYIIGRAANQPHVALGWKRVALYAFAANAPDLDFLPGLFTGALGRYHHGPSHSVAFAMIFGVVAAALFAKRRDAFLIGFSLYASHLFLDCLVQDPSPPFGVPFFWPLTNQYYMASVPFYRPFHYPGTLTQQTVSVLLSLDNFLTMLSEIVLALPLLALVCWFKRQTGWTRPVR